MSQYSSYQTIMVTGCWNLHVMNKVYVCVWRGNSSAAHHPLDWIPHQPVGYTAGIGDGRGIEVGSSGANDVGLREPALHWSFYPNWEASRNIQSFKTREALLGPCMFCGGLTGPLFKMEQGFFRTVPSTVSVLSLNLSIWTLAGSSIKQWKEMGLNFDLKPYFTTT